jgi:pimeloyl-CoA synthetase
MMEVLVAVEELTERAEVVVALVFRMVVVVVVVLEVCVSDGKR